MSTSTPTRTALIIAFATIYIVWGSTYLAIRVAVETMPPFAMAATRFLIAGTLMGSMLLLRGAAWPTARQWRDNVVVGLFLLLGGNGLVVWAEQFIPSGVAALLIGIGPLFIVLIEWVWPGGTRPSTTTIAALIIGLFGVAWLAAPWESASSGGLHIGGVIALIMACALWSLGSIVSRHAKSGAPPLVAASLQMLGGGAGLTVAALAHGDFARVDLGAITPHAWISFIYLIIFGSLVGYSAFAFLIKHSQPARVATFAYVNPVVAVFLGWFFLDEPITARTLVASAIIITAVMIITLQKAKPKASPAPATMTPIKPVAESAKA
ncbi:drug/metabolite exporter YedA [Opitutaceae bacterium]